MSWPPLVGGEIQLTNPIEMLRRQIHPNWEKERGVIGSDMFKPGDGRASTTMDSVLSAQQAHSRYENPTVGSCAVAVSEVNSYGSRAIDDSAVNGVPIGHAYIDLRGLGVSARDRIAKKLKRSAMGNGIWRPTTSSDSVDTPIRG